MSVGVYVLSGLLRGDLRSNEASMKYFLLGAFASGFLLYGVAFFYGATGSTRLDVIAEAIARRPLEPFVLLGMAFLLVGFGFKVALIPFQAWTPDVYEGAPTVGDRVHGRRRQGGRVRGLRARLPRRALGAGRAAGPACSAVLAVAHHDGGQRGGGEPAQREAHAGLLEHRARGLRAARPGRRLASRRRGAALLPRWSTSS